MMYSSFLTHVATCLAFSSLFIAQPAKAEPIRALTSTSEQAHVAQQLNVQSPVDYLNTRINALALVRSKNWQQALPQLQKLTRSYQDDGDTWYLLGLTQIQLAQYEQAIIALKKALSLGVNLTNVPTGSRPSNDIMIKIAGAYAALSKVDEANEWLSKSLSARYDERSSLANKSVFDPIKGNQQFQHLTGNYKDTSLTREQQWNADLDFLLSEIKRLHVNEQASNNPDLITLANNLRSDIPKLTDQQIVFGMMQMIGRLGNGHNFIVPTFGEKGNFTRLPVQFYAFIDGLYIVDAEAEFSDLIGHKVTAFGQTPTAEAMAKVAEINPRDNEMQQLWLAPYYLAMPEVLAGLELSDASNEASITVENAQNMQKTIRLRGRTFEFRGFPTLPENHQKSPQYLQNVTKPYWYEVDKSNGILYVQFNAVAQMKTQSLAQFSAELIEKIKHAEVSHLVLDLRHNSGGNGSILPPLLKALIYFEAAKPAGKLFVVMGRNTFSAAQNLLTNIDSFTNAILVGEPSGSRPNHIGEAGRFRLPFSGVFGLVSSQFHQTSRAEDHRIWIAPHMPVLPDSTSYFNGVDPAMKAIYSVLDKNVDGLSK
ncbi:MULTISPECIES: TPR end-of-group domain-containing protein [Pseudoalteromonas]|uniref:TPR end-of-group domain-containing protein n=1 Tax=Pseudoalteromonas TaxID=53246 RepID=UPI001F02BDCA|nr:MULTISPECIES: S41 family peptidase [Pseudoalteromonas]